MASGIYGSFLSYFSELFQEVSFFSQDPSVGAGYENRSPTETHMVIIQADKGSGIIGNTGRLAIRSKWLALDLENNDLLWCESDVQLKQGLFLIHPVDGRVYRLVSVLEYNREGGFTVWGISKLTGDTGNQTDVLEFTHGGV